MAAVRFESGTLTGVVVSLEKERTTFGRHASCDVVLSHPTVSRVHFQIELNAGKYFVVDNESGNGTFANGERVSWVELRHGDQIKAGPFSLIVEMDSRPPRVGMPGERASESGPEDVRERWYDESHRRVYPREYLEGIDYFNSERYFEAHESWEEVWLRSSDETKLFYQALIQAAVGLHHYLRGNVRGARGMYAAVIDKLPRLPRVIMSIDTVDLLRQYKEFFSALIEGNDESTLPAGRDRPRIRLLRGEPSQ
jgi:uncharacterized protein